MPKTDPEELVERCACWIDKDLVRQAKTIAAETDKTLQEVVESVLRAPLGRLYKRVKNGDLGGEG